MVALPPELTNYVAQKIFSDEIIEAAGLEVEVLSALWLLLAMGTADELKRARAIAKKAIQNSATLISQIDPEVPGDAEEFLKIVQLHDEKQFSRFYKQLEEAETLLNKEGWEYVPGEEKKHKRFKSSPQNGRPELFYNFVVRTIYNKVAELRDQQGKNLEGLRLSVSEILEAFGFEEELCNPSKGKLLCNALRHLQAQK